jgi:formate C-acetyltransferase
MNAYRLNKEANQVAVDTDHVLKPGTEGAERIRRLRDGVVDAVNYICIERARLVTEATREYQACNVYKLRSEIFRRLAEKMSVYILDDELIVGHQAEKRRSSPIFPEYAVEWIKNEIDMFETRHQDRFVMAPEVKKAFLEEIYPFWKGRTFSDRLRSEMPEDIRLLRFEAVLYSTGLHEEGGLGHVLHDYGLLIREGTIGLKKRVREKMSGLSSADPDAIAKLRFYESCLSVCDSVVIFAKRYAALAQDMAKREKDSKRAAELLAIADVCSRVPEHPAQSFYEGLQSIWFWQLLTQVDNNAVSITPGRFDQYMYGLYAADIARGVIDKARAQELLEAFWIKFSEPLKIYCAADAASHAGFPMGQNLCIGGLTEGGLDATNDLSYRCLEAHSHVLLNQPNFSARVHTRSPRAFMTEVARAISLGNGMPQISNDEVFIPAIMDSGVPLKEARNYAPVGCIEGSPFGLFGRLNGGYFNLLKVLELTLTNGRCLTSGKQVSPETGDARQFGTFDELLDAFEAQMKYCVDSNVKWNNSIDSVNRELMPVSLTSLLMDDCIEKGADITSGGMRYNWNAPLGIAIANIGNSLMGIKTAVFDRGYCSMATLVDAIERDFDGYDVLRQYLLNRVSHYGNDDPEVDGLVKYATDTFFDSLAGYKTIYGGDYVGSLVPVSSFAAFGEQTGASADGRLAHDPLADGISPANGTDLNGPTAVFNSVCMIDMERCPNGVIFNMKFDKGPLATPEGLGKFVDLIRTYVEMKGGHIQFNVVSADMLRDAQKSPQHYKGLVVRVAGYSAFFNELSPEIQDGIIGRTAHQL